MIGHVEIWSKPNCPYCSRAKNILRSSNIIFTEKVLDKDFTREILQETYPTAKTFPVVVVDGFYIGGYSQLAEKLNEQNNSTQQLLNEQVM
jgi:glutaredoxin 3